MKAKATMNFNTAQRRYRAGEDVALADVGAALFSLCTDFPKPVARDSDKEDAKSGEKSK